MSQITSSIGHAARDVAVHIQRDWHETWVTQFHGMMKDECFGDHFSRFSGFLEDEDVKAELFHTDVSGYGGTFIPPSPEHDSSSSCTPTPQSSSHDFENSNEADSSSLTVITDGSQNAKRKDDNSQFQTPKTTKTSKNTNRSQKRQKLLKPPTITDVKKKKSVEEAHQKPWYRWENDVRRLTAMLNLTSPRDGPRRYYKLFERHNNGAIQRFDQMRSPFTVSNLPKPAPPQYQAGPLYSPIIAPYPPVNIRLP